jgi:hypothetical protein
MSSTNASTWLTVLLFCEVMACSNDRKSLTEPVSSRISAGLNFESKLRPREVFPLPASDKLDPEREHAGLVVLKFQEGTHVRLREGKLLFDEAALSEDEFGRIARLELAPEQIQRDVEFVNKLLATDGSLHAERMFNELGEEALAAQQALGQERSGDELADLDLYYRVAISDASSEKTTAFISQLTKLFSVESAYAQPISVPQDIAPVTSIDLFSSQGYLGDASLGGVESLYAWNYPGARGDGVSIIDVEQGWVLDHEDLPGNWFFNAGWNVAYRDHGTAVLGILGAVDNGYGVTGMVGSARLGVSSEHDIGFAYYTFSPPAAIARAANALSAGDVLLLEMAIPGPDGGKGCNGCCGPANWATVAAEFSQIYFDIIKQATGRGVIVVEAAGNGGQDLDAAHYSGRFDRTRRDSGAIVVGAGTMFQPTCWTNFGSRVDVHATGAGVSTLGYGQNNLRANGTDERQWYTNVFSGTSSASAIVTGAVASLQGVRLQAGLPPLNSTEMRDFLSSTGSPQASGTSSQLIGPLPNLKRAIHGTLPQTADFVSGTVTPGLSTFNLGAQPPINVTAGKSFAASVTMHNTGTTRWSSTGGYRLGSQAPQDNSNWGINRVQLPGDVAPGAQAVFSFNVSAPQIPGRYDFQWKMVQDGVQWFGEATDNTVFNVIPCVNSASFSAQSVPNAMQAGQTYNVSVTMNNTSICAWTRALGFALGSQNPTDNSTWGLNRVLLSSSSAVTAGSSQAFKFTVTAPSAPGTYHFQWRMFQSGVGWFGTASPDVAVTVAATSNDNAAFVSQTVPSYVRADALLPVSITMRNTGTNTWTAGQYSLVHSGWYNESGTDRESLPVSAVPSNGTVTFNFSVLPRSTSFSTRMFHAGAFGQTTPAVAVTVLRVPPKLD